MVKRLHMRATLFKRMHTAQRVLHLGASLLQRPANKFLYSCGRAPPSLFLVAGSRVVRDCHHESRDFLGKFRTM